MRLTAYPSEQLKIAGVRNPATANSTATFSSAVDMTLWARIAAFVALGDMANETVDVRLESDTVDSFDDDLTTLVAATQLAASASANDNKQIILEAAAAALPAGHRYVRARIATGNTTGGAASILILGVPYYSDTDHPASLVETKRV